MPKIAVIGSPGAGKTTLAVRLGAALGVRVIHLDRLYWHPGWVPTPREEWIAVQEAALAGSDWIVDGNYGATMDLRLAAADTVVFLDLPAPVCLWRALGRALRYHGRARPDMGELCRERIDLAFLGFVWGYRRRSRPGVLRRLAALPPEKRVFHLRRGREVGAFLREVRWRRAIGNP